MTDKQKAKFVNHNRGRKINFKYTHSLLECMPSGMGIGDSYDPKVHTIEVDETGICIRDKKTGDRLVDSCWCCYDKVIVVVDL